MTPDEKANYTLFKFDEMHQGWNIKRDKSGAVKKIANMQYRLATNEGAHPYLMNY